jgi:hypothetical protein
MGEGGYKDEFFNLHFCDSKNFIRNSGFHPPIGGFILAKARFHRYTRVDNIIIIYSLDNGMGNIIIFYIKSNKWRSLDMIAQLADSYLTTREEFELTSGYQPIDSLFYVKKGSFLYKTENGEFIAKSGDFIIFNKSTRMQRTVLSSLEMLYIKFYPSKGGLYEISLSAPLKAEGRIREDLDFIEQLSTTRTESSLKLRNHYFNDLLITLLDKTDKIPLSPSAPIETAIDKAMEYIEKNGNSVLKPMWWSK